LTSLQPVERLLWIEAQTS